MYGPHAQENPAIAILPDFFSVFSSLGAQYFFPGLFRKLRISIDEPKKCMGIQ